MEPVQAQSAETRGERERDRRFVRALWAVALFLAAAFVTKAVWRIWLAWDYRAAYSEWLAEPEIRASLTRSFNGTGPSEGQPWVPSVFAKCHEAAEDYCYWRHPEGYEPDTTDCELTIERACWWFFEPPLHEVCTAKPPAFECHLEER